MPVGEYFKGHGMSVMKSMKKKYGPKAKAGFYATANKMKKMPHGSRKVNTSDLGKGYMVK